MGSCAEILDLEDAIRALRRELESHRSDLDTTETKLRQAEEDKLETESHVESLTTNRNFLCREAPVVNLSEFADVSISLAAYKEHLVGLRTKIDGLNQDQAVVKGLISKAEEQLQDVQKRLGEYRRLIPFRRP
jgi:chromosome segregation ATPase